MDELKRWSQIVGLAGLLALLADDGEDLFPNPGQLLNHAPGFYFMWK